MDKCPCCERKFQSIYEFPLIYLSSFERLEVKETILEFQGNLRERIFKKGWFSTKELDNPAIPREVIDSYRRCGVGTLKVGKMLYERRLDPVAFYQVSEDVTDAARPAIDSLAVKDALSFLESLVDKEIDPNILKERFQRCDIPGFGRNFCLYLNIGIPLQDGSTGGLLLGDRHESSISKLAPLARFKYDGRLRLYQPADLPNALGSL